MTVARELHSFVCIFLLLLHTKMKFRHKKLRNRTPPNRLPDPQDNCLLLAPQPEYSRCAHRYKYAFVIQHKLKKKGKLETRDKTSPSIRGSEKGNTCHLRLVELWAICRCGRALCFREPSNVILLPVPPAHCWGLAI